MVKIMVIKHAPPPKKLEMGSARKTPVTPQWNRCGKNSVSGMTMKTFRKSEKKMACFERPSPTAAVWPANCKAIMKKPKKYICMEGMAAAVKTLSEVKIRMKNSGQSEMQSQMPMV